MMDSDHLSSRRAKCPDITLAPAPAPETQTTRLLNRPSQAPHSGVVQQHRRRATAAVRWSPAHIHVRVWRQTIPGGEGHSRPLHSGPRQRVLASPGGEAASPRHPEPQRPISDDEWMPQTARQSSPPWIPRRSIEPSSTPAGRRRSPRRADSASPGLTHRRVGPSHSVAQPRPGGLTGRAPAADHPRGGALAPVSVPSGRAVHGAASITPVAFLKALSLLNRIPGVPRS